MILFRYQHNQVLTYEYPEETLQAIRSSNDPFEKREIDEFYFFDNSEPNNTDSKPYVGI